MPFFNSRNRLQNLAAEEARGVSFWTSDFSVEARVKVLFAANRAVAAPERQRVFEGARQLLREDEGWLRLPVKGRQEVDDIAAFVGTCEDKYLPSAIEALFASGSEENGNNPYGGWIFDHGLFADRINGLLREFRISFELVGGIMIPLASQELHSAVTMPTLQLLHAGKVFRGAEQAYLDALDELAKGRPDDAITDAARALQETLLALGCVGNALGPLLMSAKKHGLLGPHDQVMTDGIAKIIDWVSADRTAMGDAHTASRASLDDAWFSVHVVGALILRLSRGPRRT